MGTNAEQTIKVCRDGVLTDRDAADYRPIDTHVIDLIVLAGQHYPPLEFFCQDEDKPW